VRRELRRAILRGALPSLLGLAFLPFEWRLAPGVVFFALIGAALSLIEEITIDRLSEGRQLALLSAIGAGLYVLAWLQGIYCWGVLEKASLAGGLAALAELRDRLEREQWTFVFFMGTCLGVAHADALVAANIPRTFWGRTASSDYAFLSLVAVGTGVFFWLASGPKVFVLAIGVTFALLAAFVTLAASAVLNVVTVTCDTVERRLWPEVA
jgi:hypothetical protein